MKKIYIIVSLIVFIFMALSVSQAEPVPSTINYQGYLGNSYGMPLPDGRYDITFSLYKTESGGDALWTETWQGEHQVTLTNGRFYLSLGTMIPFKDMALNFREKYHLQIAVVGYGTLEPRIELTSAPYANNAENIDAMNSLSGTVVGTTDVQTITEKTISLSAIQGGTIDQAEIGATTPAEGTFTGISANGNLTVHGKILTRTKIDGSAKTGSYTLAQADDIILANATGGPIRITLPSAADQSGKTYTVFLTAAYDQPGGNDLVIATSGGETINGIVNLIMNRTTQSIQVVSDGLNWQVRGETGGVMATQPVDPGIDVPPQTVHNCDMIIDGSECIGFDCVKGELFGDDTLRLKENNLRILFQDTSDSASFPTNDWRMTGNDSVNGGRNYFSVDDVDGGISGIAIANSGNVNIGYNGVTPQGRLRVHVPNAGTGTVTTIHRPSDRTGTITSGTLTEQLGTGKLLSSEGTTVDGKWTAFTTELIIGCRIICDGEEKTVIAIQDNVRLEVDSAWSTNVSSKPFSILVTPVAGTDTLFITELKVYDEINVGNEIKKIFKIESDTELVTYGRWDSSFTNEPLQTTIPILTGDGTRFVTGEAGLGDTIIISGEAKQVTAINSDTEIQVDSFFETDHTDASYAIIKTEFIVADDGKTGIGTVSPDETFEIEFNPDTDVDMVQGESNPAQSALSLRSQNGTKFFISVDNSGNLSGSAVKP